MKTLISAKTRASHYVRVDMATGFVTGEFSAPIEADKPADKARAFFGTSKASERIFVMLGNEEPWRK